MKATVLYRIAAVIFVLFALGHTFGFLTFRPHSAEGLAVYDSMNRVHFLESGNSLSYGNFYRGFGLAISVFMVFSAYLSWHLGWLARAHPQAIGMLGWIFCVVQVSGIITGWIYFTAVQALFSALIALCIGLAAAITRPSPAAQT
jgi:hypothetical protein